MLEFPSPKFHSTVPKNSAEVVLINSTLSGRQLSFLAAIKLGFGVAFTFKMCIPFNSLAVHPLLSIRLAITMLLVSTGV